MEIEQFLHENLLFIESDVNFIGNSVLREDFIEMWNKSLECDKFQENYRLLEAI